MKIVLKNADFSNVKIGEELVLDDDVQKYIDATGSTYASAINTFVNSLKTNNLYELFDRIYIPANGASSFNKAFVNLKTATTDAETTATDNFIVSGKGCNMENLSAQIKLGESYNSTNIHVVLGLTDSISSNNDIAKSNALMWIGGISNDQYFKGFAVGLWAYKNLTSACGNNYSEFSQMNQSSNSPVQLMSFAKEKPQVGQCGRNGADNVYYYTDNLEGGIEDNYTSKDLVTDVSSVTGDLCLGSKTNANSPEDSYPFGQNITFGLIMTAKQAISDEGKLSTLQTICKALLSSLSL